MKALVIYESMFGDNQQVARAITEGLIDVGAEAEAVEVGVAPTSVGARVDLLVVGSPNHAWSLPRASTRQDAATKTTDPLVSQGIGIREWLENADLTPGVRTAAYDTRGVRPKAVVKFDHASASIEKGLATLGGVPALPAEHFHVADMKGPLMPGEVDRARGWGRRLGNAIG